MPSKSCAAPRTISFEPRANQLFQIETHRERCVEVRRRTGRTFPSRLSRKGKLGKFSRSPSILLLCFPGRAILVPTWTALGQVNAPEWCKEHQVFTVRAVTI